MRNLAVPVVAVCMAVVALAGCAMVTRNVPLPTDAMVTPPDIDIPPEIAAYSGKWEGTWNFTLDHVLMVERIEGNNATVIYAYGMALKWNIQEGGFGRASGTFKDGALVVKLPRAVITYRMQPDGTLTAKFDAPGSSLLWSIMKKTAGATEVESARR